MKLTSIGAGVAVALLMGAGPLFGADAPAGPGGSLDDLLNIPTTPKPSEPSPNPAKPEKPEARPARPEEPEPATTTTEPFQAAVGEMKQAAGKLGADDVGIDTQRLQERAIRRLDQLIAQLSKQRQSKSKSNQPRQQDTGSQANAQQQAGPQQNQGGQQAATAPGGPTDPQQGRTKDDAMAERLAEWGNLPPRLRDQLLQGMEDRFSSLYRDMTEKYYRRLAEQQQQNR